MGLTLNEKLTVEDAFENKVKTLKDDSEESKTVTSAVSGDKHLEKNRGGGSWNHEKSDDKTLRWISGATLQLTRTHCWIMIVLALMVLIPIHHVAKRYFSL